MSRGSSYFNRANNAHLSLSGNAAFAIATSTTPFTIEAWVRPQATDGRIFSEQFTAAGNTISLVFGLCNGTGIENQGLFPGFGWYNGSTWVTAAVSTTALSLNVWTHVACVFTGSTSRVYIGGADTTKSSTPTPSTTWGVTGVSGDTWYIGRRWDTTAGGTYFSGFIHDLRFVNGTAVYTGAFTPTTTGLTAVANTVLLTCNTYERTVVDTSTNNFSITNSGVSSSAMTPDRGSWMGEAAIVSEDYNAMVIEDNTKGRWSTPIVGPNY